MKIDHVQTNHLRADGSHVSVFVFRFGKEAIISDLGETWALVRHICRHDDQVALYQRVRERCLAGSLRFEGAIHTIVQPDNAATVTEAIEAVARMAAEITESFNAERTLQRE